METMNEVPDLISSKDLDYLSDCFNWNYGAYKNACNGVNMVEDEEIKTILEKGAKLFNANIAQVIEILGGKCNE